jgi:hypothetical protein
MSAAVAAGSQVDGIGHAARIETSVPATAWLNRCRDLEPAPAVLYHLGHEKQIVQRGLVIQCLEHLRGGLDFDPISNLERIAASHGALSDTRAIRLFKATM